MLYFLRFVFFGVAGALLGWLAAEPWIDKLGFFRDFLLIFAVCLGITMAMITETFLINLKFRLLVQTLLTKSIYISIFIGALAIKLYFSSIPTRIVVNGKDESTEIRYLLLDVSSSMNFGFFHWKPMAQLKKAVNNYITIMNKAESNDRIGCIVFSQGARQISEPITDYQMLNRMVQGLNPAGGTEMANGLKLAHTKLNEQREGFPREIVLVSDGFPNDRVAVLDQASKMTNIKVNTVGVGSGYDADLLRQISDMTGGTFYPANDVTQLSSVFAEIVGPDLVGGKSGLLLRDRLLGWGLFGLLIGLTVMLVKKSHGMFGNGLGSLEATLVGLLGGLLGGVLGALGFVLIDLFGLPGPTSRGVGFGILGFCFGLAIFGVEQLFNKLRGRGI